MMVLKLARAAIVLSAALVITGVAAGGHVYLWEAVTWIVSAAVIIGCTAYARGVRR